MNANKYNVLSLKFTFLSEFLRPYEYCVCSYAFLVRAVLSV